MQLSAIAKAHARKERATLERLLTLEAALRDVAVSGGELAARVEELGAAAAAREEALRQEINGALGKVWGRGGVGVGVRMGNQ
eukprot:157816-Chlamydomonas_euryale.AAC.1